MTSSTKHSQWDFIINQGVTPHPEVERPKVSVATRIGLGLGVMVALASGVLLDGLLISLICTYLLSFEVSLLQGVGARLLIQFFLPKKDN